MRAMRKRVFQTLEGYDKRLSAGWWVGVIISSIIFLNILALVFESIPHYEKNHGQFFNVFEQVSIIIFSVEYLLRLWASIESPKFNDPIKGRVRYIFTPLAVVDLLAILPFFLGFLMIDLRFLRALRLFRLFRILKIARYVNALQVIGSVLNEKKEKLFISLVIILFLLLFVSSMMYFAENTAQPDAFRSIPEAMWWGVATLTTVGYGDIYPITTFGKVLGDSIAIIGIGLFALPAGILASGFSQALQDNKRKNKCPNCGEEIL